MKPARKYWEFVKVLLGRPDLWGTAVGVGLRLMPDRWWRKGIVPPKDYLTYRTRIVYGLPFDEMPPAELIRYLEWCKLFPGPIQ
jgi:hypothetical protein